MCLLRWSVRNESWPPKFCLTPLALRPTGYKRRPHKDPTEKGPLPKWGCFVLSHAPKRSFLKRHFKRALQEGLRQELLGLLWVLCAGEGWEVRSVSPFALAGAALVKSSRESWWIPGFGGGWALWE